MTRPPDESRSVKLPGGRCLCYAEYGDPEGPVVLFFHGTPGSRLDAKLLPSDVPVRLIAPDRPGFGHSDAQAQRTLLGWADDVKAVTEALGLDRFAVVGISGGGPHALACAAARDERLTRCGVMCGLGPVDRPGAEEGMNPFNVAMVQAARTNPEQVKGMVDVMAAAFAADPIGAAEQMAAALPETDRAFLARPSSQEVLSPVLGEGFRQGSAAAAQELVMLCGPWGFQLADIACDVGLIQGDADVNAPIAHAQYMASVIPGAQLEIVPGRGHYSVLDEAPRFLRSVSAEA